ncbi:hypothetical protein FQK02_00540 [Xanthomonas vasicola]|uniref:hypothetical protein n=1 Tax=Xanthomonas vasicola TaxID=56459 RepID=UPI000F853FA0|nr:hypothetical protein [Xanthomonas vasicola]AZR25273.1 hypothetical protein NX80_000685 [Xanthomonas vasicola pv. arecae]MBV6748395.1 hypothetical protein [Xanthomonas vasicola pv. vasculorum NCPPB 890]MBV6894156.1 hypothetical protein [Xanthomonas vasicola pv. vasculorum]MDO6950208.1 hypothetical protein [Xanthomonas vasicola]MDO6954138.1 hypothetical protein [Xanthomonas vasicola]
MMTRVVFLIIFLTQLTGCIIGNGTICGPQTPMAMCDKKAYQALYHPTPLRDEWMKSGVGTFDLNKDWLGCGGRSDGSYTDIRSIPSESNFDYTKRNHQLFENIQHCMLNKGYIYNGRCDTDVSRENPGCQARSKAAVHGEGL